MTQRDLKTTHDDLADAIERVADGEPVLLRCKGVPVAGLVSVRDLRLLERYISELEDRIDLEEAEKALDEVAREGTVPWAEVKRELDLNSEV